MPPFGTVSFWVPEWNLERPGGRITYPRSYSRDGSAPLQNIILEAPRIGVTCTIWDIQAAIEIVARCFQDVPDRTVGTDARRFETLQLTNEILTVERVAPSGKRKSWHLQPYWLQVELDKNASPGGRLILRSHGRILEIGSFLTEGDKINLAQTLRGELAALHS